MNRDVSYTIHHKNRRAPSRGRRDKRMFSVTADRSRIENTRTVSMRGGRRL